MTYEEQIQLVRKWVQRACRNHSDWDQGDLEGFILERLIRRPVEFPGQVIHKCRFGYVDWTREILGRMGTKAQEARAGVAFVSLDHWLTPTLQVQDTLVAEEPVPEGGLPEELYQHFTPTNQCILQMLVEGYSPTEIARHFGVKRPAIAARIHRMKPLLAELLEQQG